MYSFVKNDTGLLSLRTVNISENEMHKFSSPEPVIYQSIDLSQTQTAITILFRNISDGSIFIGIYACNYLTEQLLDIIASTGNAKYVRLSDTSTVAEILNLEKTPLYIIDSTDSYDGIYYVADFYIHNIQDIVYNNTAPAYTDVIEYCQEKTGYSIYRAIEEIITKTTKKHFENIGNYYDLQLMELMNACTMSADGYIQYDIQCAELINDGTLSGCYMICPVNIEAPDIQDVPWCFIDTGIKNIRIKRK